MKIYIGLFCFVNMKEYCLVGLYTNFHNFSQMCKFNTLWSPTIIRLEQKTYFMNCKVQLNMVAWQTDLGTLSWLSERGNCGTWERSSASDRASECASACASASSTQSQQFARHFCKCNVNCKVKYDFSTNEARNNCNTSFPCDFDWATISDIIFMTLPRSKGKFQSETRNMCRPNTSFS